MARRLRRGATMTSSGAPAADTCQRWLDHRILALAIALVTIVAFLPALHNGFVSWDDPKNFLDNPHYRGLGPAQLRWMITTRHMGHYIPLSWITLGLDYLVWGMNPAGYHLTNLLLHACTAVALYFLARRLFRLALPAGFAEGDLRVGAAAAALLWAAHPLRAESVAWITERRDVLAGVFYVTSALAYLRAVASENARGGAADRRWYWTALALFTAGLLSKSITVTLPATLLVLDVYPLRRLGGARGWRQWRVWLEKVPFFVLAAAASAMAFAALLPLGNTASIGQLGPLQRGVLAVYGLGFYLWKTLVPLDLSPLYPLNIQVTWLHFGFVLAASIVAAAGAPRWPAFSAAWIVYVITLFPVLGIFHNGPQAVADRYSYLSSLGWAVLAGAAVAWRWAGTRVVRTVVAVWLGALCFLTWQQVQVWHDPITLWTQALVVQPESRAAHFNLGGAYEGQGRYAEALAEYQEVLRLSGNKALWYVTIGWVWEKTGVGRGAEEAFSEALRLWPGLPDACAGLARVRERSGQRREGLPAGCLPLK
jgi:tetratricopeptide (TPR) repeat protein